MSHHGLQPTEGPQRGCVSTPRCGASPLLRRGAASSSSFAFPAHAVFLSSREIQHITIQDCKNVNSLRYMSSNYSPAALHMCS